MKEWGKPLQEGVGREQGRRLGPREVRGKEERREAWKVGGCGGMNGLREREANRGLNGVYLSIYLSVCLSVCLSFYLSIRERKRNKMHEKGRESEKEKTRSVCFE
jgi:hypothetical protein